MISAYYKDERPASIALKGLSNLVCLWRAPDVELSLAQNPTSSIPSRNQRRINVDRVSFDGGLNRFQPNKSMHGDREMRRATFKANSYGRCRGQMIGHRIPDQSGYFRRTRLKGHIPSTFLFKKLNGG